MKRIVTANTFTPTYDEVEDRLRLVINYQDMQNRIDLMITRNFVLKLIPTTEEFIGKFYEDENLDKNESVSQTDSVNLELLRTDEELLLEVNFSFDSNTKQTLVTFNSKNIIVKASFDAGMMRQILSVIKSAIPYIKWGIAHNF